MIIQKENPLLREKSNMVGDIQSPETKKLIKKMADAMFAEPDGIGIAAPQIGARLQIFLVAEEVLDMDKGMEKSADRKNKKYITFINPVIKKKSVKKSKDIEGCLSVRGLYGEVVRREKVTIRYSDENGTPRERGASQLFARVIQHEMDHLEGVLFIDKAKNIKKISHA